MVRRARPSLSGAALLAACLCWPASALSQAPPLPPAREIPGITTEDRYPGACVDCHIRYPEPDPDARFSTFLSAWAQEVDSTLMAKARASSAPGVTLEGRHPETKPEVLASIPRSCIGCHTRRADEAPDLARLVHKIHLEGGASSVFLTVFQGECTHCHKLNLERGIWTVPSGSEHEE